MLAAEEELEEEERGSGRESHKKMGKRERERERSGEARGRRRRSGVFFSTLFPLSRCRIGTKQEEKVRRIAGGRSCSWRRCSLEWRSRSKVERG